MLSEISIHASKVQGSFCLSVESLYFLFWTYNKSSWHFYKIF